jgi:hypothetical protein
MFVGLPCSSVLNFYFCYFSIVILKLGFCLFSIVLPSVIKIFDYDSTPGRFRLYVKFQVLYPSSCHCIESSYENDKSGPIKSIP